MYSFPTKTPRTMLQLVWQEICHASVGIIRIQLVVIQFDLSRSTKSNRTDQNLGAEQTHCCVPFQCKGLYFERTTKREKQICQRFSFLITVYYCSLKRNNFSCNSSANCSLQYERAASNGVPTENQPCSLQTHKFTHLFEHSFACGMNEGNAFIHFMEERKSEGRKKKKTSMQECINSY